MAEPYWTDGQVTLWLGDCRELLPELSVTADCIVADPPYGETSLKWDRWPDGWLATAARHARSMWCFGSMRMFGDHWAEYAAARWKLSQDVIGKDEDGVPVFGDVHAVWEKHTGTGMHADRFRRVHEHALHWYQDAWRDIHHEAQSYVPADGTDTGRLVRRYASGEHMGYRNLSNWTDTGTRLMTSVIAAKTLRGVALHPTEKPAKLLTPLIRYACPPGGLVLDMFAGSGSTLNVARLQERRAIGIEADERYCELAARRLSQGVLAL